MDISTTPISGQVSHGINIPIIGNIDLSNPIEIGIWGGILASVAIPKNNDTKILLISSLLLIRWQLQKVVI